MKFYWAGWVAGGAAGGAPGAGTGSFAPGAGVTGGCALNGISSPPVADDSAVPACAGAAAAGSSPTASGKPPGRVLCLRIPPV